MHFNSSDKNWAKLYLEINSNPPTYYIGLCNKRPKGHTGEKYRLV